MDTKEGAISAFDPTTLQGLDFLWLELTGECNLQCSHCYADAGPAAHSEELLDEQTWEQLLLEAHALGCRKVQFIGGEPTMYKHLEHLLSVAQTLGFEWIEIFTNGTILTDPLKRAIVRNKVSLAFSFYSSEVSIHDAVTHRPGSQAKTLKNIMWAVREGHTVRVAIVDVGINSATLGQTQALLKGLGVQNTRIDRERAIGRGALEKHVDSPFDELCGKCWQGRLCVTATGELFPCVFSRFYSLGMASQGLRNALSSSRLFAFRARQKSKMQEMMVPIGVVGDHDVQMSKECGPEKKCNPDRDCNPRLCGPDCHPSAYCPPEHGDKPDCSPIVGGCSPKER